MKRDWKKRPEIFWFFFPTKIIITFKLRFFIFYIAYEKQKFLSIIRFAETKIIITSEGESISHGRTQKSFEIYHYILSFKATRVFVITIM